MSNYKSFKPEDKVFIVPSLADLRKSNDSGYRKVRGVNNVSCVAYPRREFNDTVAAFGPLLHVLKEPLPSGISFFHNVLNLEPSLKI